MEKSHPVEPAIEVSTTICSSSVSGKGFWLDLKARGPSGISAPRQNLRDLRPASACISGNCVTPSKAFEKCNGRSGEEFSSILSMNRYVYKVAFKEIPVP